MTREQGERFHYKRPTTQPPVKITEQEVARIAQQGATSKMVDDIEALRAQAEPFERLVEQARAATIVVVDSVTELMSLYGLNGDAREDVSTLHKRLRSLFTDNGPGVILLDHVTKSTQGRGRWASGSERKIGGLDGSAITFETAAVFGRGKTGRVKLGVSKDRPGYLNGALDDGKTVGELILTSDAITGHVTWNVHRHNWLEDVDGRSADAVLRAIVRTLGKHGDLGVNEICGHLTPLFTKKKVSEGLALLEAKEAITFAPGPNRKKVYNLSGDSGGSVVRTTWNHRTTRDSGGSGGSILVVEPLNHLRAARTVTTSVTFAMPEPTAEEIEASLIEWSLDQMEDYPPAPPTDEEVEDFMSYVEHDWWENSTASELAANV